MPPAQNDASFPRRSRVRASAEFDRVFKQGKRVAASPEFALHAKADDDGIAKLGLAVSRKVDKRAVGRSRIKRVLRDAFRHLHAQLPAGAYVIVARPAASQCDNAGLRRAFETLLRRAGALPVSVADGTIATATVAASPFRPASEPSDGSSLPA